MAFLKNVKKINKYLSHFFKIDNVTAWNGFDPDPHWGNFTDPQQIYIFGNKTLVPIFASMWTYFTEAITCCKRWPKFNQVQKNRLSIGPISPFSLDARRSAAALLGAAATMWAPGTRRSTCLTASTIVTVFPVISGSGKLLKFTYIPSNNSYVDPDLHREGGSSR